MVYNPHIAWIQYDTYTHSFDRNLSAFSCSKFLLPEAVQISHNGKNKTNILRVSYKWYDVGLPGVIYEMSLSWAKKKNKTNDEVEDVRGRHQHQHIYMETKCMSNRCHTNICNLCDIFFIFLLLSGQETHGKKNREEKTKFCKRMTLIWIIFEKKWAVDL